MASRNPFDLLGDDENDDPSQLIAAQLQKVVPKKAPSPTQGTTTQQQPKQAKLPSKPLPPSQAVREARNETGRGRGGGFNRDSGNDGNSFNNNGVSGGYGAPEDGDGRKPPERRGYDGPRGPYRGGRRGGFSNGEEGVGERPRRMFERHSGTGRGNEIKREGGGRRNWGTHTDDITQETEEPVSTNEKNLRAEKPLGQEDALDSNKENPVTEPEEKEPEDKEMTLDEYEKLLEEKRKALQALKTEERKVDMDKEFESMQQLSNKKSSDDIFIKLGSDKDKRKEVIDKEEKAKKSLSINEFLKPADGDRYYSPGGRGRGRGGRGSRGGFSGGSMANNVSAPSIEDPGHFPTLGGK